MVIQTKEMRYLQDHFRTYYTNNQVILPPRFESREWGFFLFGSNVWKRHVKFETPEDVGDFLKKVAPLHSYHSTAYYEDSGLQPMADKVKGWEGADLIFDLDADHLRNAETMTINQQLDNVKDMVRKLIYEFLLDDFGFKPSDINLAFSGNRGYHIHVRRPSVIDLDTHQRQEIVDYITGTGLDDEMVLPKEYSSATTFKGKVSSVDYTRNMPGFDATGWGKRIRKGYGDLLESVPMGTQEDCISYLKQLKQEYVIQGYGEKTIEKTAELLAGTSKGRSNIDVMKETGDLLSPDKKVSSFLIALTVKHSSIHMAGETDEPVTKDTKRMIRLMGSLHGKTALRVTPLTLEELEEFDPLKHAVVFPADEVEVEIVKEFKLDMMDQTFDLTEGVQKIPEYLACYLLGRRVAKLTK